MLGCYFGIVTADQAVSIVRRADGLRWRIEWVTVTVFGSLLLLCGLLGRGGCELGWRWHSLFLLLISNLIFLDLDCIPSLYILARVECSLIVSLLFCLTAHSFFSLIGNLLHLVDHLLLGTIWIFDILSVRFFLLRIYSFAFSLNVLYVLLLSILLLHFLIINIYLQLFKLLFIF